MRVYYLWIALISLVFFVGYNTPQPPVIKDKSIYQYMKILRDKLGNLEVITGNPNGSVRGRYGDVLLYQATGPVYYISVNVSSPSGVQWKGVVLTGL